MKNICWKMIPLQLITLFWQLAVPPSAADLSILTSRKIKLCLYLEKRQRGVNDFRNGVLLHSLIPNCD